MSLPAFLPLPSLFTTPHRSVSTAHRLQTTPHATISFPTVSNPASEKTPNHRRPPLLGLAIDLFRRETMNLHIGPESKPVYRGDYLGYPVTMISDLDTIIKIYKDEAIFPSEGAYPPNLIQLFGPQSLPSHDGIVHAQSRNKIQPAFAPFMMPVYFNAMVRESKIFWTRVCEKVEQKGSVKLVYPLKEYYLNLIIKITSEIGEIEKRKDRDDLDRLQRLFLDVSDGVFLPSWGPWWDKVTKSRDELLEYYINMIRDKLVRNKDLIEALRVTGADMTSIVKKNLKTGDLDILTVAIAISPLETGEGKVHDPEVLRDLAYTILFIWFAGHSTQASTSACCVMEMGMNEKIKDRLQAEQGEVMEKYGRELTYNQVQKKMPLLDSYLTETLRLQSPASTVLRKVKRDVIVQGHLLKKDDVVGLDIIGSMRDEKYFSDAETFKMDRFLSGSTEPATKVIAFGAAGGIHYCLGAALAKVSIKTMLATLLREFDIELDKKQKQNHITIPERKPASGVRVVRCVKKDGCTV